MNTASPEMTSPTLAEDHPLRIAMIGLRGIPASYGGVERAVEELSAHLVDRGHHITVYGRSAYTAPTVDSHRGVALVRLPQINTKHLEAATHTVLAIAHAVVSRRFDIVHLHATGPAALAPLVRLSGLPAVVTVQGLDWRREKWGPVARAVLRVAALMSATMPNRTIVVSRELARHYRSSYGVKAAYIPNGVHAESVDGERPFAGLEPDGFILFLGRLVPEKHVHTLILAHRQSAADVPLIIAGPDSHSPEYLQELRRLAAGDDRIQLVGPQYGAAKAWLLHNALAFVQPSSIEGLPIALLEALAAERFPIVSTIPENLEPVTVDGEVLGLTVPVGDVDALGEALEQAVGEPDRRAVGSRLGRHVRQEYAWPKIAAATEAVYRELVSAPR